MNTRTYHLEDAARLAMGNFIADDAATSGPPPRALLKAAATLMFLVLILAIAWSYLF